MSRRLETMRLAGTRLTARSLTRAWIQSWYGTSGMQRTPAIHSRVMPSKQTSLNLSDGKWNLASPVHGCCRLTRFTRWSPNTLTNSGSDPELVQVGLLEEVVAVAGVHGDVDQRGLAQDLEGNEGAGRTEAPDAPPQVGEPRGLLAGHLDHDVAHFDARAVGRRSRCDSRDDELRASVGGVHAEPRTRLAPWAAKLQHVVEDGLEVVDRHQHVSLQHAAVDLLLDQQRADGEELAVGADERGAAPLRMRRGRIDRLVEHVLPVAGELALSEHRGAQRARPTAVARDHHVLADAAGARGASRERPYAELGEGLHQPEAGGLIVAERKRRHHDALVGGEPDGARLGDEVADGEDEAVVADHDAVADALGAEDLRGERVLRDLRAQLHDRVERAVQVEAPVLRTRAHLHRELPVAFLRHKEDEGIGSEARFY